MAGKPQAERLALEKQNADLLRIFDQAGFSTIVPDILQPADIFLEKSGDHIRTRAYVFHDAQGRELCLRPDLTVPACRYYLSHNAFKDAIAPQARYCYCGPAFRYPGEGSDLGEFYQAGIEWFAPSQPLYADAAILDLTLKALAAIGILQPQPILGDIGLLRALLEDINMPERWRQRLRHHFWRPAAFRALLRDFVRNDPPRRTSVSEFVDQISEAPDPEEWVTELLEEKNITLLEGRQACEIAKRLCEKLADRSEPALAEEKQTIITDYLAINGKLSAVMQQLEDIKDRLMTWGKSAHFHQAFTQFKQRLTHVRQADIDPDDFHFSSQFGRNIEYYTGFVFQIEAQGHIVAGGGRYDDLLADIGAPMTISATGCALDTEQIFSAVRAQVRVD